MLLALFMQRGTWASTTCFHSNCMFLVSRLVCKQMKHMWCNIKNGFRKLVLVVIIKDVVAGTWCSGITAGYLSSSSVVFSDGSQDGGTAQHEQLLSSHRPFSVWFWRPETLSWQWRSATVTYIPCKHDCVEHLLCVWLISAHICIFNLGSCSDRSITFSLKSILSYSANFHQMVLLNSW